MRRRASFSLAAALFLVAGATAASPGYPEAMQADLGLASAPGCDLCHHAGVRIFSGDQKSTSFA